VIRNGSFTSTLARQGGRKGGFTPNVHSRLAGFAGRGRSKKEARFEVRARARPLEQRVMFSGLPGLASFIRRSFGTN
jgi:hypothetical protein